MWVLKLKSAWKFHGGEGDSHGLRNQLVQLTTEYGYSIFDHFILKCMMFLSRINMYIENKCRDFHCKCQCCVFAQRFVLVCVKEINEKSLRF